MIFTWFNIFNKTEFEATGLVSWELERLLEGIGKVDILVTKGRNISITYDEVLLSIGVTDANPFIFEGYAVYLDANNDVWLGIQVEEET